MQEFGSTDGKGKLNGNKNSNEGVNKDTIDDKREILWKK